MLFKILEIIEQATGIKPIPFATDKVGDSITYNFRVFLDDGAVSQSLLELRIIDVGMAEVDAIEKKIKSAVLKFGDGSAVPGLSSAFVNGSSYLPVDDNIIQKIVNINLKYRSE